MRGLQHGTDQLKKEKEYQKERSRLEPQVRFLDKSDQLYQSASQLKQRLQAAIDAESEAETLATLDLYKSARINRLVQDGLVLLGLKWKRSGELHGSLLYKFTNVDGGDLAYHRFNKGSTILVSPKSLTVQDKNSRKDVHKVEMSTAEGTVVSIRKEFVEVAFEEEMAEILEDIKGDLRMDQCLKDVTVKRQQAALKQLFVLKDSNSAMEYTVRKIILGLPGARHDSQVNKPQWVKDENWRAGVKECMSGMSNLNKSQQHAIATALIQSFTLWQGPPGTGKTSALISLLEVVCHANQSIRNSGQSIAWSTTGKILVCADTNAATDNLVGGLMDRGISVVRLGQPAKVREELRSVTLDALAEKTYDGMRAVAMRTRGRQQLRNGGNRHAAKNLLKEADQLMKEASLRVIDGVDVVASTCAGSGDDILRRQVFRFVIVDESTQTTEPTVLIPLLKGAECVVMAGDPLQLPPTVISEQAYQYSLQRSMFERLESTGLKPLLLDTQYRMHPGIAYFPSQWFYHGRLKTGIQNADRPLPDTLPWPNHRLPVMMLECDNGKDQKASADGLSYVNLEEAQLVMKVLWTATQGPNGVRDVVLLTPYKGQVRILEQLRRAIEQHLPSDVSVFVSSVDGYQGREAEVVIFSTVRANKNNSVGFLKDPRRLNVAITRARNGLVVVGQPQTLRSSKDWRNWLAWISANQAFQSENAFPTAPWEDGYVDVSKIINHQTFNINDDIEEEEVARMDKQSKKQQFSKQLQLIQEKQQEVQQQKIQDSQIQSRKVVIKKQKKIEDQQSGEISEGESQISPLQNGEQQEAVLQSTVINKTQKLDQIAQKLIESDESEEEVHKQTGSQELEITDEMLQKLTVAKLRKLCKDSKKVEIKGFSSMKKQDIIQGLLNQQKYIDIEIYTSLK